MRRFSILIIAFLLLLFSVGTGRAQAQTISPTDNHTAREEAEGKAIWEKLQAKQLECKNLTNDNFESLGEFFMGRMAGGSHEAMNKMMVRMMGEEGEKQMHIAMGKKNSGCDTSAVFPQNGIGFMSMMGSGWSNMIGGWSNFSLLVSLFWIVLLVDLILLGVWLWKKIKREK